MKVLLVGGGGREHALAWRLAQSDSVEHVFVAPGNAGTAAEPGMSNLPIGVDQIDTLSRWARDTNITLTVVGPEQPLALGIVDRFLADGLPCLGPPRQSARLESSKAFSKQFMLQHDIPTARFGVFDQYDAAMDYINGCDWPLVIKASGLAAGKGVVIVDHIAEARKVIQGMLSGMSFGESGRTIVIEEFLSGHELSYMIMTDGQRIVPLPASRDYKALLDHNLGPNTGGMGAYCPSELLTRDLEQFILDQIVEPTLGAMAANGMPYQGFLYVGLMLDADARPRVLEYNCRLGDPETQVMMMRLQSDWAQWCQACCTGSLPDMPLKWDDRPSVGVVLGSAGYPGAPRLGDRISGINDVSAEDVKIFHSGTRKLATGEDVTASGRVMTVCALGADRNTAREKAYAACGCIHFDGLQFRSDIGITQSG